MANPKPQTPPHLARIGRIFNHREKVITKKGNSFEEEIDRLGFSVDWAMQSNFRTMGTINDLANSFGGLEKNIANPKIKARMAFQLVAMFAQCNETGRWLGDALMPYKAVSTSQDGEAKRQLEFMREVIRMEDEAKNNDVVFG